MLKADNEYKYGNISQWLDYLKDAPEVKFINLEKDAHQEYHGLKVEKVMLDGLTNVVEHKIDYTAWSSVGIEKVVDEAIANGVHIIMHSLNIEMSDIEVYKRAFKKARDNNIFIVQAMGNDNKTIDNSKLAMSLEDGINISAVHYDTSKNRPTRAVYSNKGKCIDYTEFSLLTLDNEVLTGTSFSQPLFTKKLILVIKLYLLNNLSIIFDDIISFIDNNLVDLGEVGDDVLFGKGLFILPDITKIKLEGDELIPVTDIKELEPSTRYLCDLLVRKCNEQGIKFKIVETYRSQERQNELYAQGRTTKGQIVTWTKTSKHTTRKAFDIVPIVNGSIDWSATDIYKRISVIAKSIGLTWGGDWKTPDMPHFQYDGQEVKENTPMENTVSEWAKEAWEWAKLNGINDGEGAKNNVTEEQLMVFMHRLYKIIKAEK